MRKKLKFLRKRDNIDETFYELVRTETYEIPRVNTKLLCRKP